MRKRLIVLAMCGSALLLVAGCGDTKPQSAVKKEQRYTDENQNRLIAAQPPPQLDFSKERQNLIDRYKRWSDRNRIGFVYLISFGKIVAHYTTRGKVSSASSQLTNPQKGIRCGKHNEGVCVVDQAEPDGSYGTNGQGIFFFTTDGKYVEWQGDYIFSDQRLRLTQPPELVIQKQAK